MKGRAPLSVALAALVVAIAAWLGVDLEGFTGPAAPAPAAPAEAQRPTPRPAPRAETPTNAPSGDFDYYVLALSWSIMNIIALSIMLKKKKIADPDARRRTV